MSGTSPADAKALVSVLTQMLRMSPLEQYESNRGGLSCLRLRLALSGCIDVSGIRLLRPPRHAGLADAQAATLELKLL
jgi:hypothetical protein